MTSVLDQLTARFSHAWSHGEQLTAEQALAELAGPHSPAVVAGAAYREYCQRVQHGEQPDRAMFLQRFPAVAHELQLHFDLHDTPDLSQVLGTTPILRPTLPSIPGYELGEVLGQGSFGTVYWAKELRLNRAVAIKVFNRTLDLSAKQRFHNEAQLTAKMKHPNIVGIYAVGEVQGFPYIVLELCEGGSLETWPARPVAPRLAAELVESIALAVQHAHEQDILHRDLKPSNVLLTHDHKVKLVDFGLARQLEQGSGTQTNQALGTPSYMAPEQVQHAHSVEATADVYAMGGILYNLLTGREPLQAASCQEAIVRLADPRWQVPPVRDLQPNIPRDVATIVAKCLEREPTRRFPTALALANDLARYCRGEPVLARPPSLVRRLHYWQRRNPVTFLVLLGIMLFACIVGVAFLHNRRTLLDRDAALAFARTEKYALDIQLSDAAYHRGDRVAAQRHLKACPEDMRGFEWYALLRRLQAGSLALQVPDTVVTSAFFHDAHLHIVGRQWRQFDRTGRCVRQVPLPTTITYVAESHWNAAARVLCVIDGRRSLWLWTEADAHWQRLPVEHSRGLSLMAMHPHEPIAIVTDHSGVIEAWNLKTRQRTGFRRQIETMYWKGVAPCFSDDGRWLAATGGKALHLFAWPDDATKDTTTPLPQMGGTLAWIGSQRLVVTTYEDERIPRSEQALLFDVRPKGVQSVKSWTIPNLGSRVVAHPGGRFAVFFQHHTLLFDPRDDIPQRLLHEGHAHALHLPPDDHTLWTFDSTGAWRVHQQARLQQFPEFRLSCRNLDGDQDRFYAIDMACATGRVYAVDSLGRLTCRTVDGEEVWTKQIATRGLTEVRCFPDGRRLVVGGRDGTIRIVQADDGATLQTLGKPQEDTANFEHFITRIALEQQGEWIAFIQRNGRQPTTGAMTSRLGRWQPSTGQVEWLVPEHETDFHDFVVIEEPTRRRYFTVSDAGLREWSSQGEMRVVHDTACRGLAYDPLGHQLIVIGSRVAFVDLRSDQTTIADTPASQFLTVAVHPTQRRFITGSTDRKVQLWDTEQRRVLLEFHEHDGAVENARFSADGKYLLSAGWGNQAIIRPGH